ncbi:hypothetical protein [Erythrobacter aureus]|uniref:hypothetical protein n=1 Tax=Erythrobacter aureus TaxID=2182384 RepID=UPI003A9541B2
MSTGGLPAAEKRLDARAKKKLGSAENLGSAFEGKRVAAYRFAAGENGTSKQAVLVHGWMSSARNGASRGVRIHG